MTDWTTPKTNWVNTDIYNVEDYNRIAGNIYYLLGLAKSKYNFSTSDKVNRLDNGGTYGGAYYQLDVKPVSYSFTPRTYADEYNLYNDYSSLRYLMELLLLTSTTPTYSSGVYLIYSKNNERLYYTGYVAGATSYAPQYLWSSVMDDVRCPVDLQRREDKYDGNYLSEWPNYAMENTPFWSASELNTIESKIALVKQRLDDYNS